MKKLKLDLDELYVASFSTQPVEEAKGTVNGHSVVVITSNSSITLGGGSGGGGSDRYCLPEPIYY